MKVFFVFLGFACLASSLASDSLDFPLEEDGSLDNLMKKLENSDDVNGKDSQIIITFPPIRTTIYPPRPRPTTTTTTESTPFTTTTYPSTTTTTSTTYPPPTSTTSRPRPTRPRPRPTRPTPTRPTPTTVRPTGKPNRNPQIFKNIFDKQDPFASRLYNFVQNLRGNQAVRQSNDIIYNIKVAKALKRLLEDEE